MKHELVSKILCGHLNQEGFIDPNSIAHNVRLVKEGQTVFGRTRENGGRRSGEVPSPEDRPGRAPRQSLLWKAVLHWDHGTIPVRLRNISAEGAMLEAGSDELPAGTGVVLDLGAGGSISGHVRWSRSSQLGVQFDSVFDLRELARPEKPQETSPALLKPQYLESELDPHSPWASAWDKLAPEDLEAPENY